MISVEEALQKVLSYVEVLEPEQKPILECLGQVLAEDIYSTVNVPPLDNSAMDGFALRAEDTHGASEASPRYLAVTGEIAAGSLPTTKVRPGTAIRIMTGAPLPKGADAVVKFEDTDEVSRKSSTKDLSQIGILCQAKKGLNVRRRGEDIPKGKLILEKGTVLRPQEIGVLAALGHSTASVIRRAIVAILATGDELVGIDQPLTPGKIHDSNNYAIAAEVYRYGGVPRILGIGRDSVDSLSEKIAEGLDADMLITSGGVSKGDYDMVKDVLAEHGEIGFWTVCMKPGKPLAFGVIKKTVGRKRREVPHLGLPGNPVSSMITFEQFARPAILKMMGKKMLIKPTIRAIIEDDIANTDGRRLFARVIVTRRGGQYHASLTGPQGSGILTSMARANGLAVIPESSKGAKAGDMVEVQMLDWVEEQSEARTLPIVSIVGRSESGKTLLVEQLIVEFKRRGYKIAALKHSHCEVIEVDQPGKDTWKFAQAGSDAVCISSPRKLALIKRSDHDLHIDEVLPIIGPEFDLVLVEGFKKSKLPKIEVHRKELGNDLLCSPEELSAIVTDGSLDTPLADSYKLPILSWADTAAIADFIEKNLVLKS
ncbi:MAG: molybdopterin-guanine dinucleotide biosynthesis protein B [Chloroflexi bacterium RBG_13_51_36]|nr:MAG: molybdopterin-guanine dinucleotide biosynthesis protein B [Chloroflexi bacterium RBG_13_51_36]